MKELEKLLAKKGPKMDDKEVQAKMDVIKELLSMAHSAMGSKVKGDMDGLQKVSVMAPDKESLADGLDLAQELTESPEDEADESPEEQKHEEDAGLELHEQTPEEDEEDSMSPFMKKSSKPSEKRKKLFSMDDED